MTVDLSGYSIQEVSDTGTGTWATTPICSSGPCLINPGKYFLVQEAAGAGGTQNLPTPDATGTINLSGPAAKVALVSNTTTLTGGCPTSSAILDLVGYGATASCFEGIGRAPAPSNTTADFRKSGGCVDTNDNSTDFVVAAPDPRNSSSAANDCTTGFRPDITINDVTVTEGDSGTINASFTVTLSASSTQTVTVAYATADGTATAGADYQSNSGTLTFNPGVTTQPVTVLVNGDTLDEVNETFFVNLSNATNAAILDPQGLGTITDNDPKPSLSINDLPNITEGDSGTSTATFTVRLSAASGQTVTVNYATADGTATAGSDYVATNGTLTFNPGDTTKSIAVTINGDTSVEPDETFIVNLSSVSATATISDSQGQGTIKNDDVAPSADLSISKTTPSVVVVPGNNITYTITATNNGPTSAANTAVADTVPPNTTFQSITPPAGWTCITPVAGGTGPINCSRGSFPVGSQNFVLTIKVNSGASPSTAISNTATISSDTPDTDNSNNSSTATTNVVAAGSADLSVIKTDSPDPVAIGNDLAYTIALTNNGPASATNITVSDNLPAQVTFRSIAAPPPGWTCITPAVGTNGSITCTAPSLAVATVTFSVVVRVNTHLGCRRYRYFQYGQCEYYHD